MIRINRDISHTLRALNDAHFHRSTHRFSIVKRIDDTLATQSDRFQQNTTTLFRYITAYLNRNCAFDGGSACIIAHSIQ